MGLKEIGNVIFSGYSATLFIRMEATHAMGVYCKCILVANHTECFTMDVLHLELVTNSPIKKILYCILHYKKPQAYALSVTNHFNLNIGLGSRLLTFASFHYHISIPTGFELQSLPAAEPFLVSYEILIEESLDLTMLRVILIAHLTMGKKCVLLIFFAHEKLRIFTNIYCNNFSHPQLPAFMLVLPYPVLRPQPPALASIMSLPQTKPKWQRPRGSAPPSAQGLCWQESATVQRTQMSNKS